MKEIDTHSIQKVSIDIYSKSVENAKSIERNINTFVQDSLLPLIASYLDELEKELQNDFIQIPQINISLDLLEEDFLEPKIILKAFMNQFKEVISKEIASNSKLNFKKVHSDELMLNSDPIGLSTKKEIDEEVLVQDPVISLLKSWIYFLENGHLPWWYPIEKARDTFEWAKLKPIMEKFGGDGNLLKYFQHSPFFDRVIRQYRVKEIGELIWIVIGSKSPIKKLQFKQINERLEDDKKLGFYRLIVALSIFEEKKGDWQLIAELYFSKVSKPNRKIVEKIFREVIKFDDIKARKDIVPSIIRILDDKVQTGNENPNDIRDRSEPKSIDKKESYYISNSGLILLHPFLKSFFLDCGLIDEKGNINNSETAVHALYYLSNRKEQPFDFELVFEKYLVGVAINEEVNREVFLSEDIKDKTGKLLNALKVNWKRLGNTGIETIRNEFINRNGKLVFEENADRLIVERKGQDVLLESISWNLSLIKLPWQKRHLLVEW